MGLILDTSALIAAEKGRFDLTRVFADHETEPFFVAAVTAAELLHGVERAHPPERKRKRSNFVEAVLAQIEVIDYDLAVARRHAALWAELEKTANVIGPHDLMIAATALLHDCRLVTLNTDEFRRAAGILLLDPAPYAVQTPR